MEAGQGEDWCACLCQKEGDSVLSRRTTEAGRSAEVRVHLDRCMAGCRSRSDCADAVSVARIALSLRLPGA